ncbi:ABC transporter substrate-binding protein [Thalassobacillus devorans]|uniref:ABC transporter substrate-binding protein n=1 Tax=Thalassobacillus devorans TaxID=279813 RepID=UPI0004BCD6A8|nr:ABC transporter substrate-binding protein [Thalassobacillus devorans]
MTNVIKIGAIYPLSGSLSSIGKDIKNALELALDIVNDKRNLSPTLNSAFGWPPLRNIKVKLLFGDSAGDPSKGVSEASRLIEAEGVSALIGAYQSSVTDASSLIAEAKQIPYLSPESSAPSLTRRGLKFFFRTGADDILYTELFFELFRYLRSRGENLESFGILSEDSEFGREASAVEISAIRKFGAKLAAFELYSTNSSLLNTIERLRLQKPQVVLGQQFLSDAIEVVNTMKVLDWFPDGLVVQNAGYVVPEFLEEVGVDGNYIISRASWALGLGQFNPLVTEVNLLYRNKYGEDMKETNARSFTGMMVLLNAIKRAGSSDNDKIKKALMRTITPGDQLIMPWKGVRFNSEGQNVLADGLLVQILEQQYRIIWPRKIAEKQVVWPAPIWKQRANEEG